MAIQFPILLLEIKCDKQYTIKAPIAAISKIVIGFSTFTLAGCKRPDLCANDRRNHGVECVRIHCQRRMHRHGDADHGRTALFIFFLHFEKRKPS